MKKVKKHIFQKANKKSKEEGYYTIFFKKKKLL